MLMSGVSSRAAGRGILLAGFWAVGWVAAHGVRADDPAPNPPQFVERLESLHKAAREARARKDYAEVERLRLERREVIAKSPDGANWKQGLEAIEKANQSVARMRYKQACELLQAAWKPFASSAARQPVFGDLALELFFANEAARMIDPKDPPVAADILRECLTRAASDDPCQVEVAAALAFLTPPNADETMRRLDERRFVRDRNEKLLAIQRPSKGGSVILPWHAPVEYLLARSNSVVLADLDYLSGFLRPDERLAGLNRHGESWSLVLGGGILVATAERRTDGVRSVFKLDSYDTTARSWRQFAPEVLVVSTAESGSTQGSWQLGASDVQSRLKDLLGGIDVEWRRRADERLVAIAVAMGRPDVMAGVQAIREGTWTRPDKSRGPPPGAPIKDVFDEVVRGLQHLDSTAQYQAEKDSARNAAIDVKAALEEYTRVVALGTKAQDFFGTTRMAVSELAELRNFVDQTEFAEPAQAEPPEGGEPAGPGGFGSAPAPAPAAPRGLQLKVQLLDALSKAELVAACRDFQENDLPYLAGFPVDAYIAADAMPGPQRTAALQLKEAARQLGELLRQLCGGKDEKGQVVPKPLKLADFQALRRQLDNAFESCRQLEGDDRKIETLEARVRTLRGAYDAVVAPVAARDELLSVSRDMPPVRSWRIGTVDWKFYDLQGMAVSDAAARIEQFPPLIVAEDDLDAVSKHLAGGGTDAPAPPLRSGSSATRSPFVDANSRLNLRLRPADRHAMVIALVERTGDSAGQGPQASADDQGRPTLQVTDGEESLVLRLDVGAGEMIVGYPGLQGHIPIGITAEPEKKPRYLTDRRGYRITAAPQDGPLLFEMVAANGEKISGGYHSIADLVGIDRNIVNSFLPATLLYGPSLPAWQAYREQLLRYSPDIWRLRWAVPRPGYRVDE